MNIRTNPFWVNDSLVEPHLNRITNNHGVHKVTPQIIKLLLYFKTNRLQVCTKEELIKSIWDGVLVADNTLTGAIKTLRKVLKDDSKHPTCIETISKSGYRFIAQVSEQQWLETKIRPGFLKFLKGKFPSLAIIVACFLVVAIILGLRYLRKEESELYRPSYVSVLPGPEYHAQISPDGLNVAFSWQGIDGGDWDIHINAVKVESAVRLTHFKSDELLPSWSPDGQKIAFLRRDIENCALYIVNLIGGTPVKLDDCDCNIDNLSYSPDGNNLIYSIRNKNISRIQQLNIATLDRQNLIESNENTFSDRYPLFSSDGTMIAFIREKGPGNGDIFIFNINANSINQITNVNRNFAGFSWGFKDESIYTISDIEGEMGFWRIDLTNKEISKIYVSNRAASNPSYSSLKQRLIFTSVKDNTEIMELDFGGDVVAKFKSGRFNSSQRELQPRISPDGQRIAFISDRSGSFELYSSNRDGTQLRKHTNFNQNTIAMPNWSPDSKKIIFHKLDDTTGRLSLYVVDSDGENSSKVFDTNYDALNGYWSNDGNRIYFASNQSGEWQIWSMNLQSLKMRQVTSNGGFSVKEFNDKLYFTKFFENGIWQMKKQKPGEVLLVANLRSFDWNNWDVSKEGIFFVSRDPFTHFEFYDFTTGSLQNLIETNNPLRVYGSSSITISESDQKLFYVGYDQWETDIMMIENFN